MVYLIVGINMKKHSVAILRAFITHLATRKPTKMHSLVIINSFRDDYNLLKLL